MEGDAPTPRPGLTCPFDKLRPSQLVRDDTFYMSLAFNLAVDAWRIDEVPIGAVIERGGEIIAAAHNEVERAGDPTAHAEMLAITQAARKIGDWRLNDCTLYVTKEPCPMCAGATIMSRLGRVVYAWGDPKMGCLGGATALHSLLDPGRVSSSFTAWTDATSSSRPRSRPPRSPSAPWPPPNPLPPKP
jgi:tRNA(adenine34) deaminase